MFLLILTAEKKSYCLFVMPAISGKQDTCIVFPVMEVSSVLVAYMLIKFSALALFCEYLHSSHIY